MQEPESRLSIDHLPRHSRSVQRQSQMAVTFLTVAAPQTELTEFCNSTQQEVVINGGDPVQYLMSIIQKPTL